MRVRAVDRINEWKKRRGRVSGLPFPGLPFPGLPLLVLLLALLLVLLNPAGPARADDASLGRVGETVRPVSDGQVMMVGERVLLTVSPRRTEVEAEFIFWNDGPKTEVLMGFPEPSPDPEREEFRDDFRLHDFRALVDGETAPVTPEPGLTAGEGAGPMDYPLWHTFNVQFPAGRVRKVINTYWVKNNLWSNGEEASGYILVTGASWKGSIGEAEVRLKLAGGIRPYHLLSAGPTSYRFEGEDLVWLWKDLEPERNIRITFNVEREFVGVEGLLQVGEDWWTFLNEGRYSEALELLKEASANANGVPAGGERASAETKVIDYSMARLLELTGRSGEAVSFWERLRQQAEGPVPVDSFYPDPAFGGAYFHLGGKLASEGRLAELDALYREAREKQINPQVVRYLEELRPERGGSKVPPSIRELRVVSRGVEGRGPYLLEALVNDPDGDLDQVRAEAWQVVNGRKEEVRILLCSPKNPTFR
ncbi:MAG: hypothetical protein HYY09_05255, partial [Firmicutes bacterium]|nr:hypothetical protein [Bacillota bacterium]